jgi:Fe2+ transport system protein B
LIGEDLIGAVMGVREPVAMEIPLEEGAVNADIERRAALKERTAKSLVQKATSDSKHTEQVRSAILRKRAAAEKKRLALLEAEKRKAHARLAHIQRAAETVCSQRETERIKLKEHLDSKLQRVCFLIHMLILQFWLLYSASYLICYLIETGEEEES